MRLIDWALARPQALSAVVLLVAIWGCLLTCARRWTCFRTPSHPRPWWWLPNPVPVPATWPSDVTQVLEKELNTLDGVVNLTSTSRDGVAAIGVEFGYHKTLSQATAVVGNALDRVISDLPEQVARPRVFPVSEATSPVMTLALRPESESPKDLSDVRLLAPTPSRTACWHWTGLAMWRFSVGMTPRCVWPWTVRLWRPRTLVRPRWWPLSKVPTSPSRPVA